MNYLIKTLKLPTELVNLLETLGFPTDLQAQWVALMSLSDSSSIVTDTVYHDRFSHIPELARLGANIKVEKNTAFIRGVDQLVGAPVMSTDIRASSYIR